MSETVATGAEHSGGEGGPFEFIDKMKKEWSEAEESLAKKFQIHSDTLILYRSLIKAKNAEYTNLTRPYLYRMVKIGSANIFNFIFIGQDKQVHYQYIVDKNGEPQIFESTLGVLTYISSSFFWNNLTFEHMRILTLGFVAVVLTTGLIIAILFDKTQNLEVIAGILGVVLGYVAGKVDKS